MILIVDDEKNHRHMLNLFLTDAGYDCIEAGNGVEAIAAMQGHDVSIILLDITMDIMDGLTFLSYIRENGDNTPVIMISANAEAKTAVSAMKLGAADYLTKPIDTDELIEKVGALLDSGAGSDNSNLPMDTAYTFSGVYSEDGLGKIIKMLKMVTGTDATVLILGESGTGKELIAKSIHDNSPRANKPFVAVNAAALNENLIESELFGHVQGAFTGATANHKGRFEEANGGTLFLDEMGELPMPTQVKLLRFLQDKSYEAVGSSKTITSDVRIIAATNKDLEEMVSAQKFRQDLYFRLAVFPVELPALRDRVDEIPLLVNYFIAKHAGKFNKKIKNVSKSYLKMLMDYPFPGNVRELENLVERSLILAQSDTLEAELLPNLSPAPIMLSNVLKENEKQLILNIMEECGYNKTKAASRLGISRRGLYNKLSEHGIE